MFLCYFYSLLQDLWRQSGDTNIMPIMTNKGVVKEVIMTLPLTRGQRDDLHSFENRSCSAKVQAIAMVHICGGAVVHVRDGQRGSKLCALFYLVALPATTLKIMLQRMPITQTNGICQLSLIKPNMTICVGIQNIKFRFQHGKKLFFAR